MTETRSLKATHYGTVTLGDIQIECAVLEDGRRGFVQRQMAESLGFTPKTRRTRFARFLARIGINSLETKGKSGWPVFEVAMPHGGTALWTPAESLTKIIKATIRASAAGKLTTQQTHIAQQCMVLADALIGVGVVALIDEATGYQYAREPQALQDLLAKLIRSEAADWERRFPADYYAALCKLFGFRYEGKHRSLPSVIGAITLRWVYEAVFPRDVVEEIKNRRGSEKLHQWLSSENGVKILESQIAMITTLAATSTDYRDFEARCALRWPNVGQQLSLVYPMPGRAA